MAAEVSMILAAFAFLGLLVGFLAGWVAHGELAWREERRVLRGLWDGDR